MTGTRFPQNIACQEAMYFAGWACILRGGVWALAAVDCAHRRGQIVVLGEVLSCENGGDMTSTVAIRRGDLWGQLGKEAAGAMALCPFLSHGDV